MVKQALALIALWLAAGCGTAGPAAPRVVAHGQDFSLRLGESAQSQDGRLRIVFEGVSADSRCGRGEQCVWAGDATVRLRLQRDAGPSELRELHTAPNSQRRDDPDIQLLRLDPEPSAATTITTRAYVATLVLKPAGAVGADR